MHFAHDTQFQKLLRGEADIDVVALLLEYARDAYPDLDPEPTREALDALGDQARSRLQNLPTTAHDADRLRTLSRFLYQTVGFRGNDAEYYHPDNSYLNVVVERRLGIPISLGIVYMAIAERAGISMFGIGAPGHFVIGRRTEDDEVWYVDPFTARIALLEPETLAEQRDLGLISLRAGDPREARKLLEVYSAQSPAAEQAELERYIKAARRMSAELN